MAARAMWKGRIQFGNIEVPVKLYAGLNDQKVHFRLLHAKDLVPVVQKMVHPRTGEVVDSPDTRQGYEIEPGRYVILDPEELEALEPEPSRRIHLTAFVAPTEIGHAYYDRPYFLGPDSSLQAYATMAAALEKCGLAAIARWTMRKKSYVGALHAGDGLLQLVTLRSRELVVEAEQLPRPAYRELEDQERRMAEQLVKALERPFEPAAYTDDYRDRVRDLIAAKARGAPVERKPTPKPKPRVVSLAEALKKSVKQAQEERRKERKVG
ncbi:MAG: Ku protein [Desulfobacterales bacterium]